ncbi:hypothetical protein DFH08DRAFT_1089580 [Mycena albidolilacea]|uniref:Uncharacterized protein n=1 Tax=Mycena albidolilacea TaxID=1033008 RepID=A0AAD6Z0P3_9AGAR|nr:hypothetical protein DFH08DRAFT_1089580 [Mycena albidolilacea]
MPVKRLISFTTLHTFAPSRATGRMRSMLALLPVDVRSDSLSPIPPRRSPPTPACDVQHHLQHHHTPPSPAAFFAHACCQCGISAPRASPMRRSSCGFALPMLLLSSPRALRPFPAPPHLPPSMPCFAPPHDTSTSLSTIRICSTRSGRSPYPPPPGSPSRSPRPSSPLPHSRPPALPLRLLSTGIPMRSIIAYAGPFPPTLPNRTRREDATAGGWRTTQPHEKNMGRAKRLCVELHCVHPAAHHVLHREISPSTHPQPPISCGDIECRIFACAMKKCTRASTYWRPAPAPSFLLFPAHLNARRLLT